MPDARPTLRGLYAITDAGLQHPDRLIDAVTRAIDGGAQLIQYRDKSGDTRLRSRQASALATLCNTHNILLIINDDLELAAACGAHGVHLGRYDPDLQQARQQLGHDAIIGISCYNRLELAHKAAQQGADYIAFGRFFPSHTNPDAVTAEIDLIRQAKQQLTLPIAAIGGITTANAAPLIEAGADMLAV
ncbi:MAG TPA: thiamine phosphate synthase, partial [Gammaproteobacteria bacterium]|nr:thiamine phosphate synthase [Gammaproteobacteria bacterium]